MSEDIRCFIAITLDTEIRAIIEKIQKDLYGLDRSLRWVKPEIAHITLKFLGSVPFEELDALRSTIRDSLKDCHAFSFSLSGIGAFPNWHRPNVIWLGIKDPAEHIKTLVGRIEVQLERVGFKKEERSFHPHVTLGRFKDERRPASLAAVIEKYDLQQDHTQQCRRITLFKSTLRPGGPQYDVLEDFPLIP